MSNQDRCRLCGESSELRKSHIIPEFLYRPGYDGKGRILEVTASTGTKKHLQKGYREPLLCDDCEQRFGRSEKYFADFWYQTSPIPDPVGPDGLKLSSIDYAKFKLFLLSILWRSSVSTNAAFDAVRLGPFQEELRQILLEDAPGSDSHFQIFGCISILPGTRSPCHGVVMPPARSRGPGHTTAYSYVFGGVNWFYLVSKRTVEKVREGGLSERGTMYFPVHDLSDNTQFMAVFNEHRRNSRE